jgi:hypothetical protein
MTASRSNRQYFPMDPTEIHGGVQVNMMTARAFLLAVPKGCFWTQQNTHLEFDSRLHSTSEVRRLNDLAIISAYDFVVTPLNKVDSDAISAMGPDNIVKILGGRNS